MSVASNTYKAVTIAILVSLLGQSVAVPGGALAATALRANSQLPAEPQLRAGPSPLANPQSLAVPHDRALLPSRAALMATSATVPDELSSPVSVSRAQSSYLEGTTVITFTVTNNLLPMHFAEIPDSPTVTDTLEIAASYTITEDANTLRCVIVTDTLAAGTTLLAASGSPAQVGSTLVWNLPDIPPLSYETITVSVQTPAAESGFVELDGGCF